MIKRCRWVNENDPIYVAYHDTEWGVPIFDEEKLYEMFLLETFQAGLSWITILKKREGFRSAFDSFDVEKIACYDQAKIDELMNNQGIIRCRRKIEAAISNAKIYLIIQSEFGSFSDYLWGFTAGKILLNETGEIPVTTDLSDRISKDLKKRGMKYVGSVTIYSFLQAVGVVNDHDVDCFCRGENQSF